ncbi:probable inactive serine/threonine-protein kinase slob2 [Harmonia axyridis]|uniref:probable inactive serine/threonine-protein kinase slob2 n=1 Tax=Harmonia axyridis TaxID=115357 RepID=UPI001E277D45|nr:probable inactive serine/threonine-protein kinase slob2 [Harmonia axyridis]
MPLKIASSQSKKKPPPRPPPPNLNKLKSKSTHTIHKNCDNLNLIDWSPPNSPKSDSLPKFGGSVSSSFSSSTSSLASIKKASDYDVLLATNFSSTVWGINSVQNSNNLSSSTLRNNNYVSNNVRSIDNNITSVPSSSLFGPTIIRPRLKIKQKPELPSVSDNASFLHLPTGQPPSPPSLPMPTGPPPSPPKDAADIITPYGVALFQFPATEPGDLGLEVDDVVILIRRVNKEWLHGQVNDQEGIFPENFIQIINPLPEDLR